MPSRTQSEHANCLRLRGCDKGKYDRLIKEYDHLIWLIRTRPEHGTDFLELKAKKVLEQIWSKLVAFLIRGP
jgi:hypothetical protein